MRPSLIKSFVSEAYMQEQDDVVESVVSSQNSCYHRVDEDHVVHIDECQSLKQLVQDIETCKMI